jgi:hypothetical protein
MGPLGTKRSDTIVSGRRHRETHFPFRRRERARESELPPAYATAPLRMLAAAARRSHAAAAEEPDRLDETIRDEPKTPPT